MKNCPLATQILLKCTEKNRETQLNCKIKKFVFEELRKTPNIECIDSVLQVIKAFISDDISTKNMKNGKKERMEEYMEDRAFFAIRGIHSDKQIVLTPVDTVEEEANTKVPNASSNIPVSVNRKKDNKI